MSFELVGRDSVAMLRACRRGAPGGNGRKGEPVETNGRWAALVDFGRRVRDLDRTAEIYDLLALTVKDVGLCDKAAVYLCHQEEPSQDDAEISPSHPSWDVVMPILGPQGAEAVLCVAAGEREPLGEDDRFMLTALAESAAMAVENLRLLENHSNLQTRSEVRARRMEHVQRVAAQLKADLDIEEVAVQVVTAARQALGFGSAVLNLVDSPGDPAARVKVVAVSGLPAEAVDVLTAHDYPLSDVTTLFQNKFRLSRSYFIPAGELDITAETDVTRWVTRHLPNTGPNAWQAGDELLVPLMDYEDEHLIGFLSVDDPDSGLRPEREEIEVLETFADQAVVALRNAYLLREARRLAEQDSLTGLLNHRAAYAHLESEFARASASGQPLGIVTLDVNDFKLINDTHGHHAGDLALRHAASLLPMCARASDTMARVGGDEFLLILPGASKEQTLKVAKRLITAASETPFTLDGVGPLPLLLSFGVATYPDDASQQHALLALADARLYEAKRSGGRTLASTSMEVKGNAGTRPGFDTLNALVVAVDAKDSYTSAHSDQVASFACRLASRLGLSRETQRSLRLAGLLHDVGKIGVPDEILRKPGPLNEREWEVMRRHVVLSSALVGTVISDPEILAAVRHHHERWDGGGYPEGLEGSAVPVAGRIMIIADAASAMLCDRPYRKGLSRGEAIEEMKRGAGSQFDPELVAPFLPVLGASGKVAAT